MTTVLDIIPKRGREEELIQILRYVNISTIDYFWDYRMVGRQHCAIEKLSFTASKWLSFKNAMLTALSKNEQVNF
jgi:hypothetical protein